MGYWNKLKKLRRMSADEVRGRVASRLRQRRERSRWRGRRDLPQPTTAIDPVGLLASCGRLVPGCDHDQLTALGEMLPETLRGMAAQTEHNARLILEGRWPLLSHPFDLTGAVDWHADARTGYCWERTFYADLPLYGLPAEGDVKYPWELSRHQFLAELSRQYLLNDCQRSAARTRDLLCDWIDQNPVYEGVNWSSGLEAAMRSISWIWTLATLSRWEGWQREDLQVIGDALWAHGHFLSDNFSYYSSPYNHLIGEATGLLWIASLFEGPQARRWRHQARQTLLEAAPAQFYDDHFCVEQAVGYHYYTLGFLCLALSASRQIGEPLEELAATMQPAFATGLAFRRPDGSWPAIGDLDSARAIPVHCPDSWSFDSLHQLAASLFDDSSLRPPTTDVGQETYWLLGTEAAAVPPASVTAESPPAQTRLLLKDAGYAIASDGQDWMLFDAGPIAAGLFPDATPSTAHGHADTLQVLYSCAGTPVLDDAGMPFYGGDQDWVSFFRSPAAHNTVRIEGVELVRRAGRLAWSHEVPRPTPRATFTDEHWLCEGHVRWNGVSHQRFICCVPEQGIWIADLIRSDSPRTARWFWQLPDRPIVLGGGTATWDSYSLRSTATTDAGQGVLESARPTGPAAWRCFDYGHRQPAKRLSITHTVSGRFLALTSLGRQDRPRLAVEIAGMTLGESGQAEIDEANRDNDPTAPLGRLAGCRWRLAAEPALGSVSPAGETL